METVETLKGTNNQEGQDLLRIISDTVDDAIIIIDEGHNVTSWNKTAQATFKYTAQEMLGKSLLDRLIPEPFHKTLLDNLCVLKDSNQSCIGKPFYIMVSGKDGNEVFCNLNISAIKINDRIHTVMVFKDATDSKLKQSVITLKKVVETMHLGLCVTDMKGQIIHINTTMAEMHGYSVTELTGVNAADVFYALFIVAAQNNFVVRNTEVISKKRDKSSLSTLLTSDIVRYDNGEPISIFMTCQDMTACKKLEIEVGTYKNTLEDKIKENSLLLKTNENLQLEIVRGRQHQEMFDTKIKDLNMLLKEVHHRVKNNLQIINSLLSLQSEKLTDKGLLGMFRDIQNRVRAMALIHEKLYQSACMSELNFHEYIQDLTYELINSYSDNTSRVQLLLEIDIQTIDIDIAIPCGLVINEIISNALKYAFPNGKTGKIRIVFYKNTDGKYVLMISDDGVGVKNGIDFRNTKSLGLRLVHDLITRKLKGTLDVETDNGTKYKMVF
ncbi:signal transduction histidine kinase [Candidatus Magnetobacterium bavaricum]|uniref:Signal transduction histidine kinase n=1 Tax=Candidatus Magnetobacterium bavaricum TaxID=29290 RepID=A0A0F3GXT9_9BACT|nr:signal transduction histidine kinase [Candidatus Magnetobacterium bavaricum]